MTTTTHQIHRAARLAQAATGASYKVALDEVVRRDNAGELAAYVDQLAATVTLGGADALSEARCTRCLARLRRHALDGHLVHHDLDATPAGECP